MVTADGQVVRGLPLDHKAKGAVELLSETGKTMRFRAEQIEDYGAAPNSLMPDGLVDLLTAGEVRDLVAYLATLGP